MRVVGMDYKPTKKVEEPKVETPKKEEMVENKEEKKVEEPKKSYKRD